MIKVHIVSQESGAHYFKGKIDLEMPNLPRRGEWLELVEGSKTTYYEVVHIVHSMANGNLDVSVFVKVVGDGGELLSLLGRLSI